MCKSFFFSQKASCFQNVHVSAPQNKIQAWTTRTLQCAKRIEVAFSFVKCILWHSNCGKKGHCWDVPFLLVCCFTSFLAYCLSPFPGLAAFQWAGFLVSWTACVDSLAENLLSSFVLFLEVLNNFRIWSGGWGIRIAGCGVSQHQLQWFFVFPLSRLSPEWRILVNAVACRKLLPLGRKGLIWGAL